MATEDAPVALLAYNATERGGSPAKAQCDESRSSLRTKIRHVREFRGVKPDSDVHTHLRHYLPVEAILGRYRDWTRYDMQGNQFQSRNDTTRKY